VTLKAETSALITGINYIFKYSIQTRTILFHNITVYLILGEKLLSTTVKKRT